LDSFSPNTAAPAANSSAQPSSLTAVSIPRQTNAFQWVNAFPNPGQKLVEKKKV
jgi:hypothetical protein